MWEEKENRLSFRNIPLKVRENWEARVKIVSSSCCVSSSSLYNSQAACHCCRCRVSLTSVFPLFTIHIKAEQSCLSMKFAFFIGEKTRNFGKFSKVERGGNEWKRIASSCSSLVHSWILLLVYWGKHFHIFHCSSPWDTQHSSYNDRDFGLLLFVSYDVCFLRS